MHGDSSKKRDWLEVFKTAVVPHLSTAALEALHDGLAWDDPALVQGRTLVPWPLIACRDFPVEAACALGYCGWRGEGLETVAEVDDYFARVCCLIDMALDEPAGCRHFLNPYDELPRAEMVPALLAACKDALAERKVAA